MVVSSSLSLLIFCLLDLSLIEGFCFIYFVILILGAYEFRTTISSWWIDPFTSMQGPSVSLAMLFSIESILLGIKTAPQPPLVSIFSVSGVLVWRQKPQWQDSLSTRSSSCQVLVYGWGLVRVVVSSEVWAPCSHWGGLTAWGWPSPLGGSGPEASWGAAAHLVPGSSGTSCTRRCCELPSQVSLAASLRPAGQQPLWRAGARSAASAILSGLPAKAGPCGQPSSGPPDPPGTMARWQQPGTGGGLQRPWSWAKHTHSATCFMLETVDCFLWSLRRILREKPADFRFY